MGHQNELTNICQNFSEVGDRASQLQQPGLPSSPIEAALCEFLTQRAPLPTALL